MWYSVCAVVVTDHKLGKLEPRCYRGRLLGHAADGYQKSKQIRVAHGYYVRLDDGRELVTRHVRFHEVVPPRATADEPLAPPEGAPLLPPPASDDVGDDFGLADFPIQGGDGADFASDDDADDAAMNSAAAAIGNSDPSMDLPDDDEPPPDLEDVPPGAYDEPEETPRTNPAPRADLAADPAPRVDLAGRTLRSTARLDYTKDGTRIKQADALLADLAIHHTVPNTYEEAIASPDADKWIEAMQLEIAEHQSRQTISPVPVPKGTKVIKAKFIFKIKEHPDGTVAKYKARLVAQGFRQSPEDYSFAETFSPTIRYELVRLLIAMSTYHRTADTSWTLFQGDAVTAYLNARAKGKTYVTVPKLWADSLNVTVPADHILAGLVVRALPGLIPSGRDWNDELHDTLISIGFHRLEKAWCIYVRCDNGYPEIVAFYVDDFICAAGTSDPKAGDRILQELGQFYNIKRLGPVDQYLGMQILQKPDATFVHLEKYILDAARKFDIDRTESTPIAVTTQLPDAEASPLLSKTDTSKFRSLTGTLLFAYNSCRPDIAFAVHLLARAMSKPSERDFVAAKRVLSYLLGTARHGLVFYTSKKIAELGLRHNEADSDASYASCLKTRKSVSGYAMFIAGGLSSYGTHLQGIVSQSSCEAELVAAAECSKEVLFIKDVVEEIFGSASTSKFTLRIDNQGTIDLIKNAIHHRRTKHIDIRYFAIRDAVAKGAFQIRWVPTDENVADGFTKALPAPKFNAFVSHFLVPCPPN